MIAVALAMTTMMIVADAAAEVAARAAGSAIQKAIPKLLAAAGKIASNVWRRRARALSGRN